MTNMISTKRALRQEAQEDSTTRGLIEPHAKRPKRTPPQKDPTPREHVAENFCFEMKSLEKKKIKKKNLERNINKIKFCSNFWIIYLMLKIGHL